MERCGLAPSPIRVSLDELHEIVSSPLPSPPRVSKRAPENGWSKGRAEPDIMFTRQPLPDLEHPQEHHVPRNRNQQNIKASRGAGTSPTKTERNKLQFSIFHLTQETRGKPFQPVFHDLKHISVFPLTKNPSEMHPPSPLLFITPRFPFDLAFTPVPFTRNPPCGPT